MIEAISSKNFWSRRLVAGLDRLTIGPVLLVACLLRLISIPLVRSYQHPQTWEFGPLAENIARGLGYSDLTRTGGYLPSIYMPPAYPYFLALFYRLGGEKPVTYLLIEIVQAFFGVLLVYIVYRLALILLGKRCAVAAACITAVYPTQVYMCNEFHGISIYIVLGTATVLFLVRYLTQGRSTWDVIAGGLCMGAVMLFRGEAPALALLYAAILLLRGGKKAVGAAVIFLLAAYGCLAPWTARNYREFGKVIPVCASSGLSLWVGNNPWATGSDRYIQAHSVEGQFSYNPQPVGSVDYGDFDSVTDVKYAFDRVPLDRNEMVAEDDALKHLAINYIRTHPRQEVKLVLKKLFVFFVFDPNHEKGRSPVYWVPSVLLTCLAIWGAVLRGNKIFGDDLFLVAPVLFAIAVGIVIFVLPRYKIVVDPFIIIIAANVFSIKMSDGPMAV